MKLNLNQIFQQDETPLHSSHKTSSHLDTHHSLQKSIEKEPQLHKAVPNFVKLKNLRYQQIENVKIRQMNQSYEYQPYFQNVKNPFVQEIKAQGQKVRRSEEMREQPYNNESQIITKISSQNESIRTSHQRHRTVFSKQKLSKTEITERQIFSGQNQLDDASQATTFILREKLLRSKGGTTLEYLNPMDLRQKSFKFSSQYSQNGILTSLIAKPESPKTLKNNLDFSYKSQFGKTTAKKQKTQNFSQHQDLDQDQTPFDYGKYSRDLQSSYIPRERTLKLDSLLASTTSIQSLEQDLVSFDNYLNWPYKLSCKKRAESNPQILQIERLAQECEKLRQENNSKLNKSIEITNGQKNEGKKKEKIEIQYHLNYEMGPRISVIGQNIDNDYEQTQGPKQLQMQKLAKMKKIQKKHYSHFRVFKEKEESRMPSIKSITPEPVQEVPEIFKLKKTNFVPCRIAQKIIDFQELFKKDKKTAMKELFDFLDREIEQKPYKMMANVVVQAVLVDKISIDEALNSYQSYLNAKHKNKQREEQLQQIERERDANHKKQMEIMAQKKDKMTQLLQMRNRRQQIIGLGEDPVNPGNFLTFKDQQTGQQITLQMSSARQLDQKVNSSRQVTTRAMSVQRVDSMVESDACQKCEKYVDRGEYNKEFLQIMHFENQCKTQKTTKISQAQAIEVLLQERSHTVESEQQMKNPLNIFYKKEIKEIMKESQNKKQDLVPRDVQKKKIFDQGQHIIGSKFSTQIIDQISKMDFDHKQNISFQKDQKQMQLAQEKLQAFLEKQQTSNFSKMKPSSKKPPPLPALKPKLTLGAGLGKGSIKMFQALYENIHTHMRERLMDDDFECFMDKDEREGHGKKEDSNSSQYEEYEQSSSENSQSESSENEQANKMKAVINKVKRAKFSVNKITSFAKKATKRRVEEEAIDLANQVLTIELDKIYHHRQKNAEKVAHEAKLMSFVGKLDPIGKVSPNMKKTQVYREIEKKELVAQVLKNGENKYIIEEQEYSKEKVIIDHKEYCQKQGVVPLPLIFSNIEGNTLALFGYNLSSQAQGLSTILHSLPSKVLQIETLILKDCNLRDEGFSLILKGIIYQDCLTSISFSMDELGPKSLEQFQIIRNLESQQKSSKPLSQLSFCDLKMSDSVKIKFVETIKNFGMLRKLKISGINLSDRRVYKNVNDILKESQFQFNLQTLDFSNCCFSQKQMLNFSQQLSQNKYLSDLNLSYNIIESSTESKFCENIATFIDNNTQLTHLNLAGMNLKENLIVIKRAIDRSNSMLCAHFCFNKWFNIPEFDQNPINTIKSITEIEEKHSKDQYSYILKDSAKVVMRMKDLIINHMDKSTFGSKSKENKTFMINAEIADKLAKNIKMNGQEMKSPEIDAKIIHRKIAYTELVFKKSQSYNVNENEFMKNAESLWSQSDECYICNKSQLLKIFYRRLTADQEFQEINNQQVIQTLKQFYNFDKLKPSSPFILGSVTDWKPLKMIHCFDYTMLRLTNFMESSHDSKVDLADTLRQKIIENLHNSPDPSVSIKFPGWSSFLYDQMENLLISESAQIVNFDYLYKDVNLQIMQRINILQTIRKNQMEIQTKGKEAKIIPVPINEDKEGDLMKLETDELKECFVYTGFAKPGVHTIIVFDQGKFYFKQIAVQPRKVEHTTKNGVQNFSAIKMLEKKQKLKSMFNEFKVDNTAIIKVAFIKDTNPKVFKPYKFVRNQNDIDACLQSILQNFKGIKDTFLILSAKSGFYPNLDEQTLIQFCKEGRIIDEHFTQKDLEEIFIQANIEYFEDEEDQNPDDQLNRKEFLEVVIRIAMLKYGERQAYGIDVVSSGLQQIINDVLLPFSDEYKIREFRLKKCQGDLEVCEVLYNNNAGLRKLYKTFQIRKQFEPESAIKMLRQSQVNISEEEIRVLFAISKMTVQDEMTQRQNYFNMEFVEFMEFICRVAEKVIEETKTEMDMVGHNYVHSGDDSHYDGEEHEPSLFPRVQKLLIILLGLVGEQIDVAVDEVNQYL